MDENFIEELFVLLEEGLFEDAESFKEYIEQEGTDELFGLIQEGFFEDEDSFNKYLAQISGEPAKKKSPSTAPIQDTESVAVGQEQIIQQDSSSLASPSLVGTSLTGEVIDEPIKDPVGTRYGANVEAGEKKMTTHLDDDYYKKATDINELTLKAYGEYAEWALKAHIDKGGGESFVIRRLEQRTDDLLGFINWHTREVARLRGLIYKAQGLVEHRGKVYNKLQEALDGLG